MATLAHNGRRWEAYLYDQAKGGGETRVNNVTVTEEPMTAGFYEATFGLTVVSRETIEEC